MSKTTSPLSLITKSKSRRRSSNSNNTSPPMRTQPSATPRKRSGSRIRSDTIINGKVEPQKPVIKQKTGMEQILTAPVLRDGLLEFARKEYSQENVLLMLALQEYKNIDYGIPIRRNIAKSIFSQYIDNGAVYEVNIDDNLRKAIAVRIESDEHVTASGIDVFMEVERIVGHIIADMFLRYTASSSFKL